MNEYKEKIVLDFQGPFKFTGEKSLFCCPLAKKAGIYIWTLRDELHDVNYVYYVGETTCFAKRQREHFKGIMGLDYRILDVEAAKQGIEKIVWDGMWRDKSDKATDNLLNIYKDVSHKAVEFIQYKDIYFAPTNVETQLRKHIEGSIGWNLRNHHKDLNLFYPDDNHIGTSRHRYNMILEEIYLPI